MSNQRLGRSASCAVVSSVLAFQLSGLCYQGMTAVLATTNPNMRDMRTRGPLALLAKQLPLGAMKCMICPGRFIRPRVRISYVPWSQQLWCVPMSTKREAGRSQDMVQEHTVW